MFFRDVGFRLLRRRVQGLSPTSEFATGFREAYSARNMRDFGGTRNG